MSKSNIEWTEASWNPVVGCSILTPGCTNCYAMAMAARIEAMNREARESEHASGRKQNVAAHYDGTTKRVNGHAVWTGKLSLAPDSILLAPLKRRKPTTYFVNSMGDLFHEDCPDEWIDRVFAVMALSPQHTFQVLTKRAKRMRDYLASMYPTVAWITTAQQMVHAGTIPRNLKIQIKVPLPNVWLGVSTERQQEADERIPLLLETPAAVRFISAEPLLGPIDLMEVIPNPIIYNAVHGMERLIDWVIVGGESGPGARPMHIGWARDLRDQCVAAGVAYFFKQHGEWHPRGDKPGIAEHCIAFNGAISRGDELKGGPEKRPRWIAIERLGKARAGRLLDGIEHNDMPERGMQ